jgi:DNA-binding response OmpR family regulator
MSTSPSPDREAGVLIAEDDPDLADLYARWVGEEHDARVAYDGEQALEKLDAGIDVVLLDRMMPGLSGDAALDRIRERGADCRVAMVTAVEPDFDVIEMGFDAYLTKPVTETDLLETIDRLLTRSSYTTDLQDFAAVASKKALLEAEKSSAELESNEEYQQLSAQFNEQQERVRASEQVTSEHAGFVAVLRDIDDEDDGDEDDGDGDDGDGDDGDGDDGDGDDGEEKSVAPDPDGD